jgi:hypothetical protein
LLKRVETVKISSLTGNDRNNSSCYFYYLTHKYGALCFVQFCLWQMLAILNFKLPLSVASGNGTFAEKNKAYHPLPLPLPPLKKESNGISLPYCWTLTTK